ncbi:hypothetical protein INQ23_26220, partial [Escherichia coli]|nr:hypothetical protein [Escherichia coli]
TSGALGISGIGAGTGSAAGAIAVSIVREAQAETTAPLAITNAVLNKARRD